MDDTPTSKKPHPSFSEMAQWAIGAYFLAGVLAIGFVMMVNLSWRSAIGATIFFGTGAWILTYALDERTGR